MDVFEPLQDRQYLSEYLESYARTYAALREDRSEALALFEALHERMDTDPSTALHLNRLRTGEHGVVIVMDEK